MKISPLGIVPKKTPSDFRMIHHLSFPDKKEGSVNADISDAAAFVQYAGMMPFHASKTLVIMHFVAKKTLGQLFEYCQFLQMVMTQLS